MSEKNHWAMPKSLFLAAGLAVLTGFGWAPAALAQESKGENFSAKPAAQLFNSDCTGSGCHKGPQGLAKNYSTGGLAGFLREHYTNSRESAAALAAYLTKQPTGPEPKEKEARTPRGTKPTAAAPSLSGPAGWFQSSPSEPAAAKPKEKEKEKPAARPDPRTSTAAHHEEPPSTQRHDLERGNEPPKPSARERAQRGRHPATPATAAVPPAETPAPAAPSASEGETPKPAAPAVAAAPQPTPPPAPSSPPAAAPVPAPTAAAKASPTAGAKKQYDIFD